MIGLTPHRNNEFCIFVYVCPVHELKTEDIHGNDALEKHFGKAKKKKKLVRVDITRVELYAQIKHLADEANERNLLILLDNLIVRFFFFLSLLYTN